MIFYVLSSVLILPPPALPFCLSVDLLLKPVEVMELEYSAALQVYCTCTCLEHTTESTQLQGPVLLISGLLEQQGDNLLISVMVLLISTGLW